MKKGLLLLATFTVFFNIYGQDSLDIIFTRTYDIQVSDSGRVLKYPWAGGLNACQFSQIDLDLDGTLDLLITDRVGNVLMPFLNAGITDSLHYTYAPQYIRYFPPVNGWIMLRDYNMDGKHDIFMYSVGGMAVYRNDSDTALKFTLMTFLLNSMYYNNYINIYLTYADYPGIYDVDGDGDLDILTFFVVGSFIEYHRNMSMEYYGVPDSLEFRMFDRCWGLVYESDFSNELQLMVPCPLKDCADETGAPFARSPGAIEHVGSTLLPINVNGDTLTDLVLGDVDYPGLILLINAGRRDSARMVSQDTNFPAETRPIRLTAFPAVSYMDFDNDNVNEMVVSPFDPSPIIPENYRSVWFYENDGVNDIPVFRFLKDSWMQEDMIDLGAGAAPVVVDENADGLPDIIAGNFGYLDTSWYVAGALYSGFRSSLALFRNTGTLTDPQFALVDRDYAGIFALHQFGVTPSFGDLDGDGDLDMLLGNDNGSFTFLKNIAGPGQVFQWDSPVINYQGLDVGRASAPFLFDLDEDGLTDIISGSKTGRLTYYRNSGTATNPSFTLVTDSLGYVNVADYSLSYDGYSVPAIYRDSTDTLRVYVGSLEGRLSYYRAGPVLTDSFHLVSDAFQLIDEGDRSAPAVADLNGDGTPELLLGNYRGGMSFFEGFLKKPSGIADHSSHKPLRLRVYPNPANDNIAIATDAIDPGLAPLISVLDLSGRILLTRQGMPGEIPRIGIATLSPGAYLVSLSEPGRTQALGTALFIKN